MKLLSFVTVVLFLSVLLTSCKKGNPIPPEQQAQLSLALEDVSCTEAWVKLSTANISFPANVELLKDDKPIKTISLASQDTVLYIDSLLPNKTYNFTSLIHTPDGAINNSIPVTTLDTTSHNFTWQTWTFGGDAGSCELRDVAIINPNNIWAVGDIDIADTSINGYTTYNAIHWNGVEWELLRVQFYIFCGQQSTGTYPAKAILAFSDNDIWIAAGSQITHLNGVNQISIDCIPVSVNKLWGNTVDDFYAVGYNGKIAHYQNAQWTRIESGTDADITDIWGSSLSESNQSKIYCSVPSGLDPSKRRILTINESNNTDSVPCNGNIVSSVWATPSGIIYTSGGGIYTNKSGSWEKEIVFPDYYTYRVRGNGLNDIFVCGNYGFLGHYNGKKWKVYPEFIQQSYIHFLSVNLKDDIIAIVGVSGESALIILGERN